MPLLTFDQVFADPPGGAPQPPAQPPAAGPKLQPGELTFEQAFGGAPKRSMSMGEVGKQVLGGAATIVDMFTTGVVSGVANVFGESVGKTVAAAKGASRDEANKFGREFGEQVGDLGPLNAPFSRIAKAITGEDSTATGEMVTKKIADWIHLGGEKVQALTHGAVRAEDVDALVNAFMAGGGAEGARRVAAWRPKPKAAGEPASSPADVRTNPDAAPEAHSAWLAQRTANDVNSAQERTLSASDQRLNAQKKAHDLMQRGASKKEVEGAIKADKSGMLAEEMEAIRARRGMVAESGLGRVQQFGEADILDPLKPAPPGTPLLGAKREQGAHPIGTGNIVPLAVAATGIGLALAFPDKKEDVAAAAVGALMIGHGEGLKLEDIHALPDATPLGAMLERSATTLNTLEALPKNRFEFPKQMIEQLLKRQEVTQAERDVFAAALKESDGDTITAKQLMTGVKKATGDWELKKVDHQDGQHYEGYGLERIGRGDLDEDSASFEMEGPPEGGSPPVTSIWQLPSLTLGDNNHFSDPHYFGHTRSFEEGGVKHVVEIQSDLAQKAGKVLTEEEKVGLEEEVSITERKLQDIEQRPNTPLPAIHSRMNAILRANGLQNFAPNHRPNGGPVEALYFKDPVFKELRDKFDKVVSTRHERQRLEVLLAEKRAELAQGVGLEKVQPLLKNWHKRLVREELADSARGKENPEYRSAKSELKAKMKFARGFDGEARRVLDEEIEQDAAKLLKIPQRISQSPVVRFATADTVAKVEGWPVQNDAITRSARESVAAANRNLEQMERRLESHSGATPAEQAEAREFLPIIREDLRRAQEAYAAARDQQTPTFRPEHQGIYDRYKGDVEKFLRNLGGKPYTDPHGHTWIEVPTGGAPKMPAGPRAQMFGGIDEKLALGLGTVALGAWIGSSIDKDHPIEGAILGTIAAVATRTLGPKAIREAVAKGNYKDIVATAVGAAAGAYLAPTGQAKEGFAFGALAAAGLRAARHLPPDSRLNINERMAAFDYAVGKRTLENVRVQSRVAELVPSAERRAAVNLWLDGDKSVKLSVAEQEAASMLKTEYARFLKEAQAAGVLEEGWADYAPRILSFAKDGESKFLEWLKARGQGSGASFTRARTFPTIAELKASPLYRDGSMRLKTEDAADLYGKYADSMTKVIKRKELLNDLQKLPVPGGKPKQTIVAPERMAPKGYSPIPQVPGLMVHPDVQFALQFAYDAKTPLGFWRAYDALNSAQKLSAVMGSLFHATSLGYAYAGSAKVPLKTMAAGAAIGAGAAAVWDPDKVSNWAQLGAGIGMFAPFGALAFKAVSGTHPIFKEIKAAGGGPLVNSALRDGVRFSIERHGALEDTRSDAFTAMMEDAGTLADKTLPGLGKAPRAISAVVRAFDKYMWSRLHTTLKLVTYQAKKETILRNNALAAERDPAKVKILSDEEAGKIAASYTNDMFGGLNWRQIASEGKSRWTRELGERSLNPTARKWQQRLMFAPDWFLSTTRAFTQAFQDGAGVKGLMNPRTLADLHRQYIARSALFYMLAGDGLNYAMSGHHIWQNKKDANGTPQWWRLELGDGRTMSFNKHALEIVHLLNDPAQTLANKLAKPVAEGIEQITGKEYISAHGKAPPMDTSTGGRALHALRGFEPIAAQSSSATGSVAAGVAGSLGIPIYGKSKADIAFEKRKKAMQSERAKIDKLRKKLAGAGQ